MTKWEAMFGSVRQVQVERETDKSVYIDGRRRAKDSNWQPLFDTEREAWEFALGKKLSAVVSAKNRLEWARAEVANLVKRIPAQYRAELTGLIESE